MASSHGRGVFFASLVVRDPSQGSEQLGSRKPPSTVDPARHVDPPNVSPVAGGSGGSVEGTHWLSWTGTHGDSRCVFCHVTQIRPRLNAQEHETSTVSAGARHEAQQTGIPEFYENDERNRWFSWRDPKASHMLRTCEELPLSVAGVFFILRHPSSTIVSLIQEGDHSLRARLTSTVLTAGNAGNPRRPSSCVRLTELKPWRGSLPSSKCTLRALALFPKSSQK